MSAFEPPEPLRLLVGCYTGPRGTGSGILLVTHDHAAGRLTATGPLVESVSPSALAVSLDGTPVFPVEESAEGAVHSFAWESGTTLRRVSTMPSGGADPCQLSLDPSGEFLLVANYSGSTVAALPVGPDGALGEPSDLRAFSGSGPDANRQEAAHPHQVVLRPGHSELVVADLGADLVRRLEFDPIGGRFGEELPAVPLPAGSGPRQIVFTPDGLGALVLGELDSSLAMLDWSSPQPSVIEIVPCFPNGTPPGNLAATLLLEGSRVFASQRGADLVSVFSLADGPLAPGSVAALAAVPAHGGWPRHIVVVDDWLYLANEQSGTVVALRLHETGDVADVLTVSAPSATFVLPLP